MTRLASTKAKSLKPCPFCGDEAYIETEAYGGSAKWVSMIACSGCAAKMTDLYGPPETAVKYWNQRKSL